MTGVEKITKFKCSDGTMFDDERVAAAHEAVARLDDAERTLRLIAAQDQGCGGNLSPEQIYRAMQRLVRDYEERWGLDRPPLQAAERKWG